jgi:ribonuclease BN (tRNA processing enzyme)
MGAKITFVKLSEATVFQLPGGAIVEAGLVNHPGCALGYRLMAEGKVLVYTTDNEPFGEALASRHLVQPSHHLHLARDADLLIQDAQYTPEEYKPHRIGWGHSTYLDALSIAEQAHVKRLVLFHHDPSHTDADIDHIVTQCRAWIKHHQLSFTCVAAAEGIQITL